MIEEAGLRVVSEENGFATENGGPMNFAAWMRRINTPPEAAAELPRLFRGATPALAGGPRSRSSTAPYSSAPGGDDCGNPPPPPGAQRSVDRSNCGFFPCVSHYWLPGGLATMRRGMVKSQLMAPRTLYEKIWDAHVVHEEPGQPSLIYIDRHLIHEVTSPQAFAGLKAAGRKVRRPELTFAVMDHSVSTKNRALPMLDADAAAQFEALARNCREYGINLFDMHSQNQGIVHVIGPELGITQPGCTIVCGDSHTSTHGAFGALAFGIGTSEVEHVLATQCLSQFKSKTMKIDVQRQAPARRHRQGHHSRHHRQNRNRRRQRTRRRIHRRSRARPFHGRPHDDVQHVHRRRRARRNGGAGRDDIRLYRRAGRSCRAAKNFKKRWSTGSRSRPIPARSTTRP